MCMRTCIFICACIRTCLCTCIRIYICISFMHMYVRHISFSPPLLVPWLSQAEQEFSDQVRDPAILLKGGRFSSVSLSASLQGLCRPVNTEHEWPQHRVPLFQDLCIQHLCRQGPDEGGPVDALPVGWPHCQAYAEAVQCCYCEQLSSYSL